MAKADSGGASSVIHISSTRALMSEPNSEGYAASKGGLCALAHAQAISLGSQRVRVNSVLPGWIDTGGYPITEGDASFHPVGRVGIPTDVAQLCLFLADDSKSGFITGQQFIVDGGVTSKMVYPE
jgi:NAD(P)-dependent dehydrogenase (short-subunit alcohol dehydrogenase family)